MFSFDGTYVSAREISSIFFYSWVTRELLQPPFSQAARRVTLSVHTSILAFLIEGGKELKALNKALASRALIDSFLTRADLRERSRGGLSGRITRSSPWPLFFGAKAPNKMAAVSSLSVCLPEIKRDLLYAVKECSERGLLHSAKW